MAIRDNFWAYVTPGPPDICWEWSKGLDARGYGQLRGLDYETRQPKTLKAHRVAYEKAIGPIPKDLLVRHLCHNPKCCNPNHLAVGTDADNHRDMVEAGRHFVPAPARGEACKISKLTERDIEDIRASNASRKHLAIQYNVSCTTIWQIKTRRTWNHV